MKSLGVYIDEKLTWNLHIEHISKKIASCIGILKRSRSFVPFEMLLCIYLTIRPVALAGDGSIAHEVKPNGLLTRGP